MRSAEECKIQEAFVYLFGLQYPNFQILLRGNANGELRDKKTVIRKGKPVTYSPTGAKLRRMGVQGGDADLQLLIPTKKYHGLFLECKTRTGTQSDNQIIFQREVENQGYCYVIFRSAAEGLELVKKYLKG